MEPRILTSNQSNLYQQILKLIKKYRATHRTFLRSPLRYCIDQIRFLAFNRKNNSHESSIIITELFTEIVILESITFEDFAAVLEALELDFKSQLEENGVSELFTIFYNLVAHISDQMCNTGEAVHSLSSITDVLRSRPQFSHTFDPRNIACYDQFLSRTRVLRKFNIETLAAEARIVLNTDTPLSLQTVLIRGLAHAILRQADPESHVDHGEQLDVEAGAAIRLVTTAILQEARERRVAAARAAYAEAYPYRHAALVTALRWTKYLSFLSPAYACAVLSTFFAREFSEFVVDRARQDIQNRLNITFSLHHTTGYNSTINSYINNTQNVTLFVPQHSSEYFPEWYGLANGIPSYFSTLLSCIQLLFALPPTVLGVHRRVFTRRYLEDYTPTSEERATDLTFQSILIFRWFGNLALQPADCISHPLKDAFFKWSIFRYFTPSSAIEEPCKDAFVHNVRQRFSTRNAGQFHANNRQSLAAAATILGLEYLDTAVFGFKNAGFTFFVKIARTLGAIRPIVINRIHGNVLYNPKFESLVLTNLVRIAGTVPLLPLYDTFGNQLRYMNLLTAIDVIVTSNVDARSSQIFNDTTILEEHLTAIEDITQNALDHRGVLVLLAPELYRRFDDARYSIPISVLLEENHEEAQKKRASRKSINGGTQATMVSAPKKKLAKEMACTSVEGIQLLSINPYESEPPKEDTDGELSHLHESLFYHNNRKEFLSEPEKRKARKPLHKKQPSSIYTGESTQQDKTKKQKKKKLTSCTPRVQPSQHIHDDVQFEDEVFTMPEIPQPHPTQPQSRLLSFLEFAQADLQALEQQSRLSTDAYRHTQQQTTSGTDTHQTGRSAVTLISSKSRNSTESVNISPPQEGLPSAILEYNATLKDIGEQENIKLTTAHLFNNVFLHKSRTDYSQDTQHGPGDDQHYPLVDPHARTAATSTPAITLTSSRRRNSTDSVHPSSPIFVQQSTGSNEGENTCTEDNINPSSQVALASVSSLCQGQFHQQQQ